jgi:hypothetical protein
VVQVYHVLETLRPGSFLPAHEAVPVTESLFRYFSIVTITTVGYGDIVPVSAAARSLANLEALVGQLYLVIQVAGSWGCTCPCVRSEARNPTGRN